MKNILIILFCLPMLISAQATKKVLVIGIDGCRADALSLANTPTIDNLISNGIFSPDALNDDITVSGPGWSAILCGVWSNKHLSFDNSFSGTDYVNYPPVFKYIEDFDNSLHTVSICNWNPINDYIVQNHADLKLNVSSDSSVSAEAANYITNHDPDFLFLHFDNVDHVGHSYGFSPNVSQYITAIEEVDILLSPIMQSIFQRPNYVNEDWLVLLTSDHGGVGTSHGGTSIEHQNVVVLASGNTVSQNIILKDSSLVFDSVFNCLADTVELRFDGIDDYVQIPSSSNLNFGMNQDFTVECRVRTNFAEDVAIIGNKDWVSGNNTGFVLSFKYPSGPQWKVNIGDGVNRADINTGGLIADNQWHTLSVSFDRDGYMKMYEDGQIIDSVDISLIGDITTNAGLFFGLDINQAYPYNGSISEVRVWDALIDNQTIDSWHCSHLDNTHPDFNDLIGYWKLTDGSNATQVIDYSTNNNNGNVISANWYNFDSTWLYDYTNTPRITDVPVTALTHLCIPIDASWNLDGVSLIPNCMGTILEETDGDNQGLIKVSDILGRPASLKHNNPLFYIYENGKVEKKIILE